MQNIHPNEAIEKETVDTIPINEFAANFHKLPILNFIELSSTNPKLGFFMDSTYKVCMVKSKANTIPPYKLKPLKTRPLKWQNGYSRGYAVSKSHSAIVYWLIIW